MANPKTEPAAKRGPGRPKKPTLPALTPEQLRAYAAQADRWQKSPTSAADVRAFVDRALLIQAQAFHDRALQDPGQVGILAHRAFIDIAGHILAPDADPQPQARTGPAALLSRVQ